MIVSVQCGILRIVCKVRVSACSGDGDSVVIDADPGRGRVRGDVAVTPGRGRGHYERASHYIEVLVDQHGVALAVAV